MTYTVHHTPSGWMLDISEDREMVSIMGSTDIPLPYTSSASVEYVSREARKMPLAQEPGVRIVIE